MRRQKFPPTKCLAIDIDGTLICDGMINDDVLEMARTKKEEGFDVILWSARGRAYAEMVAKELEIENLFTFIISKPGFIVDDMGWGWTRFTRVVRIDD